MVFVIISLVIFNIIVVVFFHLILKRFRYLQKQIITLNRYHCHLSDLLESMQKHFSLTSPLQASNNLSDKVENKND